MRIFFVGGTAQAQLNHQIISRQGHTVPFIFDRNPDLVPPWDCTLFSDKALFDEYARECDGFLVCIGGDQGADRVEYSLRLEALGLAPIEAVHETAVFGETIILGKGLQAMTGATVTEFGEVGDYCLLNTNCTIDHDCRIGSGVHIMGSAAIAGAVTIRDNSSIGTNATILPNLTIGRNSYVGAGAVVTRDVPDDVIVTGVPAKILRPH